MAILIANVGLSQTTKNVKNVTVCDSTKKQVLTDLKANEVSITLSLSVDDDKYKLCLFLPTDKPNVVIDNFTLFTIKMQDDSSLVYFTRGTAVAQFSTHSKQYEHFLMLEGDYNDEQWNHLVRTRIKSIKNLTGKDYLINPEESKRLLAEIKCYATNLKKNK